MPRFHFNVFDGPAIRDVVGTELGSTGAARSEAYRRVGALIQREADRSAPGCDWWMEVTDSTGLILFRLDFTVSQAAALL